MLSLMAGLMVVVALTGVTISLIDALMLPVALLFLDSKVPPLHVYLAPIVLQCSCY